MKVNVQFKTLDDIILNELKNRDFPMSEIGTYFYKDIIKGVVISLKDCSNEKNIIELRKELLCPCSQFYSDIIKNDSSVDIREFHNIISSVFLVVSNNQNNFNYMNLAFELGYSIYHNIENKVIIKDFVVTTKKTLKVGTKRRHKLGSATI